MQNLKSNIRIRKDYRRIKSVEIIPDLIDVQKTSYADFLNATQQSILKGFSSVLNSIFPIYSADGRFILEFVSYYLDEAKYDINECKQRGSNYASPVKLKLRLITNDVNRETGSITVKDIKEQDIYLCDLPLMTEYGTFVINGTERVIVSQIYRSPGVFFDHDKGKVVSGKLLYSASIIPHNGSWLDIEFDAKDLLHIRIDKRKKLSLLALLRSLDSKKTEELRKKAAKEDKILDENMVEGMSDKEILDTFYDKMIVNINKDTVTMPFIPFFWRGRKLSFDIFNSENKEIIVKSGTTISEGIIKKLAKSQVNNIEVPNTELVSKHVANDIVTEDGEIIVTLGGEITPEIIETLQNANIKDIEILLIDNINVGPYILNTVLTEKLDTREKALNEIYKIVKSSDAPSLEVAAELLYSLFFTPGKYDLSEVGRVKINERLGIDNTQELILTKDDIINIIKVLIEIRDGKGTVDDIDHLGNRRIRSVGELVENDLRIVFLRVAKIVQEKMIASEEVMPSDLVNVKLVQSALREFFGSSQLSQFMDQTNPLSEITHKRRISALGPKGLTRDRANFEVRDVHVTHYGRICPIETPEGPNIGLINSLAIFAKVNKYGFLETPYRKVINGIVTDEVVYMTANKEAGHVIAQSSTQLDKNNKIIEELVSCRISGEITLCSPEQIDYMDVSPKQIVSVAAALVPFLENDDANRALMGANMQRQAVPLLKSEAPLVGTGIEALVASDSGAAVVAKNNGQVHWVDGSKIIIKVLDEHNNVSGVDVYNLQKFQRSNHNTCVNQKPKVKVGQYIKKGEIIADGHSIDNGELALGKNVLVAFVPWNGYNYEDSILISERVVKDDVFTSIHIEEFEVVSRDTKLGAEEITADIPNISEEAVKNLDQSGVVYVGAEIKPGDILVGKVTPKAESIVTAEEKLLRAIFGEKATDVKDTSLRVPSGIVGTVIGVRIFSRRGVEKDNRSQFNERIEIDKLTKERAEELSIIQTSYLLRLSNILDGQEVVASSKHKKGEKLTKENLSSLKINHVLDIVVKDKAAMVEFKGIVEDYELSVTQLNQKFDAKISNLQKGDDLPTGVLKMVKVFVAVKRRLQPGDKMAGRHGNKGVVSRILPVEDMPFLEDGTPVDICLNPLGVPSRMNVGQILEVHMGWACANVGKQVTKLMDDYYGSKANIADIKDYLLKVYGPHEKARIESMNDEQIVAAATGIKKGLPIATSVFDGVREEDINEMLEICGLDTSGQMTLIDGRTGETFSRKVTVGYIYMLKLHHLVDEKIHARSIGPYSLITQQPLGGKAQFGGQRFGEMEVWALEAYGAAYILQEMLTVKSDDQTGRTHVYDAIIKGEETFETGIPESFNVLVKELRSLCLNLETKKLDVGEEKILADEIEE